MKSKPLSEYILSCSATMVGVCLTSIGLVKIIEEHNGRSHVDEYLALDSIIFLFSAFCAYLSLRHALKGKSFLLFDALADYAFVFALFIMVVIATLFAYETI